MNDRRPVAVFVSLAVVLSAVFLGGATAAWSRALVCAGMGAVLLLHPSHGGGSRSIWLAAWALLGTGLCALLPAGFFGAQAWRNALAAENIPLAATLSPQPWITLESWLGLLCGVTWMLWLSLQPWSREARRTAANGFAAGAGFIALVAIGVSLAQWKIPFWTSDWNFGPFPNRNQTGNFFAIGAIMAVACAREDWMEKRKRVWCWLPILLALVAGVAMSFSRGSMLVLAAGIAAWLLTAVCLSRSLKSAAVAASVLFLLATVLLVVGGPVLARFGALSDATTGGALGFRALVHQDCLALIHSAPWCGIGLGNFDAVFPPFRHASSIPQRVLHPESDWLWLAAEMGWPAVAMLGAGIGLLARRIFPLEKGTGRHLRAAAALAALGFVLHASVDVGGHRLGTALAAMFVFNLALRSPDDRGRNGGASVFFLLSGTVLIVFGMVTLWSGPTFLERPSGSTRRKDEINLLVRDGKNDTAIALATRALAVSPLDWELYFWRGVAEADARDSISAVRDFRRANFLEPHSPDLPFEEGRLWLKLNPSLALNPWREAFRRCPRGDVSLYARMLDESGDAPELRWPLYEMGADDPASRLVFLQKSTREEFAVALKNLLRLDPDLTLMDAARRAGFLQLWQEKGNVAELTAWKREHPAAAEPEPPR